jgi:hypothetical protein
MKPLSKSREVACVEPVGSQLKGARLSDALLPATVANKATCIVNWMLTWRSGCNETIVWVEKDDSCNGVLHVVVAAVAVAAAAAAASCIQKLS